MKKRIRKKLHKRYLGELVYYISISAYWRKKLMGETETRMLVNSSTLKISCELNSLIRRYDLNYYVSTVPHSKTIGWEDWGEDFIYFKFEASEFPAVQSYSVNNRRT